MAGQKRTRNGNVKSPETPQQATVATPPCAQPPIPSSTSIEAQRTSKAATSSEGDESQKKDAPDTKQATQETPNTKHPPNPKRPNRSHSKHSKLPKLPPNTIITKRPLLHPPLPTPFASSSSPKVLYITASTPFVPALKRIRKLLAEITRREKQSSSALAKRNKTRNGGSGGKLKNGDVEVQIAEDVAAQKAKASLSAGGVGGGSNGEKVHLKATGRAIPRALELGVQFQGEESGEYVVKVEMGSVRAVDDVEVSGDVEGDGEEEDIPETRIRNVSSVTVSIGMK